MYGTNEGTLRRMVGTLYDADDARLAKLYRVNIPSTSQFLQWDVVRQPPIVNKAFRALFGRGYKDWIARERYEEPTGKQCYQTLATAKGSSKAASLALLAKGVHGIRYLDGFSRSKGRGSYNYVLFDASFADITTTEPRTE